MIRLGVNIDHVATLRNARNVGYPDIVQAALVARDNGAEVITIHLREDRRHIRDEDVIKLKNALDIELNLEMAATFEMVEFALKIKPNYVCLVPEKRQELTTEGGLDVVKNFEHLNQIVSILNQNNIKVSLFIDANEQQIQAAQRLKVYSVELHTGEYANLADNHATSSSFKDLYNAAIFANKCGLIVNAGHGLDYTNIQPILTLPHLHELNIGFAIVAQGLFIGLDKAISQMKQILINRGV